MKTEDIREKVPVTIKVVPFSCNLYIERRNLVGFFNEHLLLIQAKMIIYIVQVFMQQKRSYNLV